MPLPTNQNQGNSSIVHALAASQHVIKQASNSSLGRALELAGWSGCGAPWHHGCTMAPWWSYKISTPTCIIFKMAQTVTILLSLT